MCPDPPDEYLVGPYYHCLVGIATSLIHSELDYCNSLRIEYKVLAITYKNLQSGQPSYLHSLLTVQSNRATRSSDIITPQRPSVRSRLRVTDRSLAHHAPVRWDSLPKQHRQPSAHQSLSPPLDSTPLLSLSSLDSTPLLSLSSHQFHS